MGLGGSGRWVEWGASGSKRFRLVVFASFDKLEIFACSIGKHIRVASAVEEKSSG